MKFINHAILGILGSLAWQVGLAQVLPKSRLEVQIPTMGKNFQLFLLAGQSNMAGRGNVEPEDTIPNNHILLLNKKGQWEIAKEPVHDDGKLSGLGPGLSFAKSLLKQDTSVYIGLIPCAASGSSINTWLPAYDTVRVGRNYERAIRRTKLAAPYGKLIAILWNQGETDCTKEGLKTYQQKMFAVINGFRRDLGEQNLFFIGAKLPLFQKHRPPKDGQEFGQYVDQMNDIIIELKSKVKNYDYVSSDNTTDRGDHLHYNSASARLIGERYANAVTLDIRKIK